MKLLDRMRALRSANRAAIEASKKVLEDAGRNHETAVAQLNRATKQAEALSDMNHRNHYSESLTYAFRGRTI